MLDQITVLIITYNEENNIDRTMRGVDWASRILVVDSGSTDSTLEIVGRFPQAQIIHRVFDSFAEQCNFGLSKISTRWVLSLDADYELSSELGSEIMSLREGDVAGYSAAFVYRIHGHPLRASLYPPRTVLYLRDNARYQNEGHGHRVVVKGPLGRLRSSIFHDDRKPLARWLSSQQRYARLEVDHLLSAPDSGLRRTDRIRRTGWLAPPIVFLYTLFWKRCFMDGWAGWNYVLQRTIAESMIALEIADRRLRRVQADQQKIPHD